MPDRSFTEVHALRFGAYDLLPFPVAVVDVQGNILYHNPAFYPLIQQRERAFQVITMQDVFADLPNLGIPEAESKLRATLRADSRLVFDIQITPMSGRGLLDGYVWVCMPETGIVTPERQVQEMAEHHQQFLSLTNTAVIIHRNGHIVYANPQAGRMIGIAPGATMVGSAIWEFVAPEFRDLVQQRLHALATLKQPTPPIEQQFVRADGSKIDVEVFAFPVTYEGEPAIKTFVTDITTRKQAERALHDSRQRYQNLVENITDIIFQTDTEGRFTFINSVWEHMTGYPVEETIGQSCFVFLHHPQNTSAFRHKVRRLLAFGVQEFQYDLLLTIRDGAPRYVEASIKPIHDEQGNITGINGILRDIHARKMADMEVRKIQRTLKEHQAVLTSLTKEESIIQGDFETAMQQIAKVTARTMGVSKVNIWQFNEDYETLQGIVNYQPEGDQFMPVQAFHLHQFPRYFGILLQDRMIISDHANDDERLEEFRGIYIEPEQIVSMMDVAIVSGDRVWGVICMEAQVFHKWTLEDQSFARSVADFIALAYKSHMLQHTQQALLEKETQYRTLVEQARDAILIVSADDRFLEVNAAACALTGYSREELLTMHIRDLIPERYKKYYQQPAMSGRDVKYYFGERIYVRKDGQERIAEISSQVLKNGLMQGIVRDVTERKTQESALRESETRLELALKGADLGTWDFYIRENRMVHNRRWAEMLGYRFENTVVTEEYWDRFIHPEDKEMAMQAFQEHLAGKRQVYEAEIRMLASNGEWKWILDKGKVVEWDRAGRPVRASGIHQDITHIKSYQQQLMHQKMFLQELIDAIPNLIYVRNAEGAFILANASFKEYMGMPAEGTGLQGEHVFTEALQKLMAHDQDVIRTARPIYIDAEEIMHRYKQQPVYLQTIKLPFTDAHGQVREVLSVSVDVTELKLKESEVMAWNDMLESKVAERTLALEQANKELETFNYSVSHDLRTPLRSIDIFAYLLEKHHASDLDTDGLEHLKHIRNSVLKMSRLIDNLLILSRMGRNDRNDRRVTLTSLVEDVVDDFRKQQELSAYEIKVFSLPEVWGDQDMLRQALVNVIGNAIKYASTRKRPVIEIFSRSSGQGPVIAIKDNGVGFSAELRDKLFKPFKRLHSDEQFEGSGIGLAIVDRIIRRHGGHVWAESVEGRGSTFYFSLPEPPAQ